MRLGLLDIIGGFRKEKFVPPPAPVSVEWQSLTANGTSGSVSTTQLTATFSEDPGLTTSNFVVTGASKGVVSKVGAVYTININSITVIDGQSVTLDIINVPTGFTITPTTRTVIVYKASELEAPTFEFDLVFPELTEGDTGTFDASYCFAGEIDSYSIASGALPAWLTFDTETAVFTYTAAELGTVSGISVTATNTAGSATSNTADLVVVESVEGEGTTYDPALFGQFYGSPNVNVTGIVIDDITIFETPDTNPKAIKATLYGNVRASGTRSFNSFGYEVPERFLKILPTDLDYRFVVTYADGTPVEDEEGLVYPNTTGPLNPYTDQYGYNLTVLLRDPTQQYKITSYVYGKNGDLIRGATHETLIGPFEVPVLEEVWYSHDTGNDANDGGDLLGIHLGTAFPAGSFDNSTRILTSTGAFASYDHVAASAGNRSNRFDKIKLLTATEAGFSPVLAEIESKVSDDAVVLKNALGANYTGITSSNGPKLTITISGNSRRNLKKGGNYPISGSVGYGFPTTKEYFGVGSGTKPRVTPTTSSRMIDFSSNQSGNLSGQPDWLILSDVIFDAEFNAPVTGGVASAENGVRNGFILLDRTELKNSNVSNCFGFNFSGTLSTQHKIRLIQYGGFVSNLNNPENSLNKKIGMYFTPNPGASYSIFATKFNNENTDGTVYHHPIYPSGDQNNAHVAFCDFGDGVNNEYAGNFNMLASRAVDNYGASIVGNYISSDHDYGFDFSKTEISSDECYAHDLYVVGNKCNALTGFMYQASVASGRVAYNDYWRSSGDGSQQFFVHASGWMPSGFSSRYYLDNNRIYGSRLVNQNDTSATPDYYEITTNTIQHNGTNTSINLGDINFTDYESKVSGNNIYTINATNVGQIGTTNYNLADYNAITEGGNTSVDPEWNDPANGDFSTGPVETFFTDFSTDTIGQLPANTILKRNAVAGDYQVVDQSGTNVLRYLATTGSGQRGLAFPLESSGVVEIYTEIMEGNAGLFRSTVYAIDSPVDEYGGLLSDDVNILQTFRRGSGTFSQIASLGYNVLPDRYYALLFKVTPGSPNTIQAKAWDLSLGETEPVSWMLSNTNANLTLVDGWLGLGASTLNVTGYCRKIGIGINGQPAPRS